MNRTIRALEAEDYLEVKQIHQWGIATGNATFEDSAMDWESFHAEHIPGLSFVAERNSQIVGWISASPHSIRKVYECVVMDSLYIHPEYAGQGFAGELLDTFIDAAREQGRWAIHTSNFPENIASQKVHESKGFTLVGTQHHMAYMTYGPYSGQWRDAVIMELVL